MVFYYQPERLNIKKKTYALWLTCPCWGSWLHRATELVEDLQYDDIWMAETKRETKSAMFILGDLTYWVDCDLAACLNETEVKNDINCFSNSVLNDVNRHVGLVLTSVPVRTPLWSRINVKGWGPIKSSKNVFPEMRDIRCSRDKAWWWQMNTIHIPLVHIMESIWNTVNWPRNFRDLLLGL
jgi:hypothetical protein